MCAACPAERSPPGRPWSARRVHRSVAGHLPQREGCQRSRDDKAANVADCDAAQGTALSTTAAPLSCPNRTFTQIKAPTPGSLAATDYAGARSIERILRDLEVSNAELLRRVAAADQAGAPIDP